jgi:hypothetical protein
MAFVIVNPGDPIQSHQLDQVINALNGTAGGGQPVLLVALNDATNYALTVQNDDATNQRALNVLNASGASMVRVDTAGVTLGSPLNLPTGSVTSAAILDGTVATVDLAAGAIHQYSTQYGLGTFPNSGFSTTSTTPVKQTDYHLAITTTGGQVLVVAIGAANQGSASAISSFAIVMDNALTQMPLVRHSFGSIVATATYATAGIFAPSAGAHVFDVYVSTNSGTLTFDGGSTIQFFAIEFKR